MGSNSPVADQTSDQEEIEDPDGQFAFKRKRGCAYLAPIIDRLGNWPWCPPHEGGSGDRKYRFCLTSLSTPNPRCIGFSRRRIGRGGRYATTTHFIIIAIITKLVCFAVFSSIEPILHSTRFGRNFPEIRYQMVFHRMNS